MEELVAGGLGKGGGGEGVMCGMYVAKGLSGTRSTHVRNTR